MDLDHLARSLASGGSRRHLLGVLGAVPVVGGLLSIFDLDDVDAKERRRRRKQRHKRRKKPGSRKKGCKAKSRTTVCAGRCGSVKSHQTCGKPVDCGSCDCDPPCGECFTCQGNAGAPGTCVPQAGGPCGNPATCEAGVLQPQGSCTGSGVCQAAEPVSCAPYTNCDEDACATTCSGDGDCVSGTFCESGHCVGDLPNGQACAYGEQCSSGHCVETLCCDTACAGECLACNLAGFTGACMPLSGTACGDGDICCVGACQECCDNAQCHDHDRPFCVDGTCESKCTTNAQCGGTALCLDGACEACDVTCTAGDHICANTELDAKVAAGGTVYVCPGRYTGNLTPPQDVTIVGAGSGEDASVDTILDAQGSGRVIDISSSRIVGLQQVHITGGQTTESNGGAGIRNLGAHLTMTDCVVSNNHTSRDENNVTARGAIFNGEESLLEMTRCTVRDNSATNTGTERANGAGGGIFNLHEMVMTDCVIRNNSTQTSAGGIYSASSKTDLTNCRITENTLLSAGGSGGGIAAGGNFTMIETYVWNNTQPDCSGGATGPGCGEAPPE